MLPPPRWRRKMRQDAALAKLDEVAAAQQLDEEARRAAESELANSNIAQLVETPSTTDTKSLTKKGPPANTWRHNRKANAALAVTEDNPNTVVRRRNNNNNNGHINSHHTNNSIYQSEGHRPEADPVLQEKAAHASHPLLLAALHSPVRTHVAFHVHLIAMPALSMSLY